MGLWNEIKKGAKKISNVAGYALAPFTAGTSLVLTDKGQKIISNAWDDFTGKTAQKQANAANLAEAERNRQFNAEEAQKNRDWQEEMSNTAITRQVQDLKNSGINPLLAAQLGGASVGAGSTASGTPGTVSPEPSDMQGILGLASGFNAVGAGVNQMAQAAKTSAETPFVPQQQQANIAKTTADTVEKQAQTQNISANTQKTKAETENIKQQFTLLSIQEQQMVMDYATEYTNAKNERQKAEIETKFYNTGFGKAVKYTGLTLSSLLPILGPIGRFVAPKK